MPLPEPTSPSFASYHDQGKPTPQHHIIFSLFHHPSSHTFLSNMTSATVKLPSYRKLRQHHGDDDDNGFAEDGYYDFEKERVVVTKPRSNSSIIGRYKLKSKLVPSVRKRRLRLRRRVVSLRRLLLLRRKLKLAYGYLRVSCQKVVKRFKDGQSHFGDLFAGNYMFLQVNPSSLKCVDQRRGNLAGAGGEQKHPHHLIQSFPSRTGMEYTFPRN